MASPPRPSLLKLTKFLSKMPLYLRYLIKFRSPPLPDLPEPIRLDPKVIDEQKSRTARLVARMEHLDAELRRLRLRPISRRWTD
jgi:hypothetical protein